MRRWSVLALAPCLLAGTARAQVDPERFRVELTSGAFAHGTMAVVDTLVADFSLFQGPRVFRTGGTLDADPTLSVGVRAVYRIDERWSIRASWLHAEARYRVQFPSESSEGGSFDLEGLILATDDFGSGGQEGQRAQQAFSDGKTDVYQVSGTFEFPIMNRWAFPYFTLGLGKFYNKSDGNVIRLQYEGDVPPAVQVLENSGRSVTELQGLSQFAIDQETNLISFGGGVRISAGRRWAVDLSVEDLMQIGADLSDINRSSTDPLPDQVEPPRFYTTVFTGTEGVIHNWSVMLGISYAVWPYGTPR